MSYGEIKVAPPPPLPPPDVESVTALRRVFQESVLPVIQGAAKRGSFEARWTRPSDIDDRGISVLVAIVKADLPTVCISKVRDYTTSDTSEDNCGLFYCLCCCMWKCAMPPVIALHFTWGTTTLGATTPLLGEPATTTKTAPEMPKTVVPLLTSPTTILPTPPPPPTAPDAA